jgi:A/G-specific adenine glycosylase
LFRNIRTFFHQVNAFFREFPAVSEMLVRPQSGGSRIFAIPALTRRQKYRYLVVMKPPTAKQLASFRRRVLAHYRRNGRSLPFRETDDPYAIVVSEIMLQQTQVERVVPKYTSWLAKFPDWSSLAESPLPKVLAEWSGLGYNRRAVFLQRMAQVVIEEYGGVLPSDPVELERFPGIGRYTARAVAAFAFGKRVAAVDTNVRKVIIHLLDLPPDTGLAEVERLAERLLPRNDVRVWHYALMDYARNGMSRSANRRIKPLSRQSKFEGSRRQIRGEIVRRLMGKRQVRLTDIARDMNRNLDTVRRAAEGLAKDGLVVVTEKLVKLAR